MQQLSQSLTENLSALDARFGQSADYYAKKIVLYGCPGCIVMFDGMASLDSLWELLLDAAGRQSASVRLTGTQAYAHILHGSAFPAESTPVQDMSQLVARLTAGMAVLLLEGCSSGIVFSVQGLKFRSVEEPSAEGNLRGSREGFTDLLRVNLSLLRRLVRTDTLVQEAAQAHTCCNTEYALCYCKDRADPAMVQRVRAILQSARPELLLDSSYFVPWLLPGKARLFTPVHYTERPAVAAAKLCEGKLVILVNGSPSALVLPALFSEQFECLDDYASTAVFSSFLRVLKYFSFYLTVFLPGVFVCVAVHLPELLPPQLLYKIEAAEKATPLIKGWSTWLFVGLTLSWWVLFTFIESLRENIRNFKGNFFGKIFKLSRSWWGMMIAHLGVAVSIVGIGMVMTYSLERDVTMTPGHEVNVGSYDFKFEDVKRGIRGPNYIADEGVFKVTENGKEVATLTPQKRKYFSSQMPMTEAAISSSITGDVYVSMGDQTVDGAWVVRAYDKPFVTWIWWGTLIMSFGAFIAMLDKRYRTRRRVRSAQAE